MIKNFIFDFGGVLLDIDMQRSYDALARLLRRELIYPDIPDDIREIVLQFETGQIITEGFIWKLQHLCPKPTPQGDEIVNAWNAMLIGWDPRKFDFLQQFRTKYNVYLLSNTNALHIDWVRRDLKNNHGVTNFESLYFDKVYYSFEVGLHKPDPEIYRFVLADAGIEAEETIFIDDALVNIHAAVACGLHGYHHDPKKDLIQVFEQHGW